MKVMLIILALGFSISSFAGSKDSVNTKADSLVDFAKTLIGTTYKWGGTSPSTGFDCSGFCRYVFTHQNVKVPRTSRGYGSYGKEVSRKNVKKGDAILFRGTDPKSSTIGHMGIVVSNPGEPLKFIHCSSSKRHYGVVITDYENSNYPKRFIKFTRVL